MTNINQEIADLKAKLAELEKKVAGDGKQHLFELDQIIYIVPTDGVVYQDAYDGSDSDVDRVSQGNVFRTEAEAIRERDKRALLQELKVFRNGYRFVEGNSNYVLIFDSDLQKHIAVYYHVHDVNPVSGWFPSREEAERAIAHFGDRLNLLMEG